VRLHSAAVHGMGPGNMEGLFRGHDGLALRRRHHQIAHLLSKPQTRIRRPLASGGSSVHSVHGAVHPVDGAPDRRRSQPKDRDGEEGDHERFRVHGALRTTYAIRLLCRKSRPVCGVAADDLCLQTRALGAWALVAAEDRLWQQRRHDEVRRVDHVGYTKIDSNAADDVGLLPAKPSLL
jgi:hypothetical protein